MSVNLPIVCCDAEVTITGDAKINFGNGCIIHPKAKIIADEGCNITFGEYNIIEENVQIKAVTKFSSVLNSKSPVNIYIGNYNHFKIGCILENTSLENYNIVEYRVEAEDCHIESNCIITPLVKLPKKLSIKNNTVILNSNLSVTNTNMKESEVKKNIKDMYMLISSLFKKHNIKTHNMLK